MIKVKRNESAIQIVWPTAVRRTAVVTYLRQLARPSGPCIFLTRLLAASRLGRHQLLQQDNDRLRRRIEALEIVLVEYSQLYGLTIRARAVFAEQDEHAIRY